MDFRKNMRKTQHIQHIICQIKAQIIFLQSCEKSSEGTYTSFLSLTRQVLMLVMEGAISTSQALGQMTLLKLRPPLMWDILAVGSFVLMMLKCKWVAAMTQVNHIRQKESSFWTQLVCPTNIRIRRRFITKYVYTHEELQKCTHCANIDERD